MPSRLLIEARSEGYLDLLLERPLIIGVSGGPDSVALLHALCTLRGEASGSKLVVVHLNHGLRAGESLEDQRFTEELAARLGLPFFTETSDVAALARSQKLSLEDAARRARYAFFARTAQIIGEGCGVAVAHTADDQAETVLMSILRGTGLAGLAGMQPVGQLPVDTSGGGITLFRPMLGVWREEVMEYLAAHNLPYRQDTSNTDPRFTRNRVRNELLPLLAQEYNPSIKSHLVALAQICFVDDNFIERQVDATWEDIATVDDEGQAVGIDPEQFVALEPSLQLRIVRRAVSQLTGSVRDLSFDQTSDAARLLASLADSELNLPGGLIVEKRPHWAGVRRATSKEALRAELELHGQTWPLMPKSDFRLLIPGASVKLAFGWVCELEIVSPSGVLFGEYEASFDLGELGETRLAVRTRLQGDKIVPLGMAGSKTLKDLYVDAKIPRAIRDRLPVIAQADTNEVLWVPGPGGHRSRRAIITERTRQVLRVRFARKQEV